MTEIMSTGDIVKSREQSVKIKRDWYQTETHVFIDILARNTKLEDLAVVFGEESIHVSTVLADDSEYYLKLNLCYPVMPTQSTFRVTRSKIEIKLKKRDGIKWRSLERTRSATTAQPRLESVLNAGPPKYPSSSLKTTDWDLIVRGVIQEEKEEKPEGPEALNAMFQQIYAAGSDDAKRAMNKSYQESGGTVLSTNWEEVARNKVEISAPNGLEWRKWEK